MFKSVFTKYIVAFMCIIGLSFAVLAFLLCHTVNSYSDDANEEILEHTARTVSQMLETQYSKDGSGDFNQYIYFHKGTFIPIITTLAEYNENAVILVTDPEGNILISDDRSPDYVNKTVDRQIAKMYDESYGVFESNLMLFDRKYKAFISPVGNTDSSRHGAVIVCISAEEVPVLIEKMMKTVIVSCLWIMVAALIAVYFISERTVKPLKEMSKAAKSFAAGKFDVRVPVKGNDEVAELATAFNNMATSLENLEDMRRTFLANVSHDMRTPMTTIAGFIDGILDGAIPPEKQNYYLEVIRTEVLRLSRLVGDLLDITRIQAGERKFTKTAFDICEMARLILISFEKQLEEKQLDVEFETKEDKMLVYADHDAIYQILYNICDNAVKFSKDGGKYKISITDKDKKVYVSVFNEGVGIPSNELPFVFERFYKADKSRNGKGTGLGLFIAKAIVDAHGEEIWVKSNYGENCEFVFTLPYTPEAGSVEKV